MCILVLPSPLLQPTEPSPVICLSGMVTISDLEDDEEYRDIKTDIADECQQFGPVQ